jgi:hypothetical protein
MAKKRLKKITKSLVISEIQIKIMLSFYPTPIRMAKIKTSADSRCWRGCGERRTLLRCWWDCKLVQPLWKTIWRFLRKLEIDPFSRSSYSRVSRGPSPKNQIGG